MSFFSQPFLSLGFLCGLAYLCGSLPFGVWISQQFGGPRDIRSHGSGSTGATNVLRFSGKKAALLTVFLDALKTFIPMAIAVKMDVILMPFVGIFGVLGHMFPIFLNFRGGKGIASALGFLLAFSWVNALILLLFWAGVIFLTRYVSLASLLVAIAAPFLFWVRGDFVDGAEIVLLSLLLLWSHRDNIKRLSHGKEPTIGGSSHVS